jgi:hypothetical protein
MKPRIWLAGLGVLALAGIVTGCGGGGADGASEDTHTVSFIAEVQPIFVDHCGPCHIEERQGELSLASYEGVTTTGAHTPVVDPGNADTSFLMVVVRSGSMPHEIPELGEADVQTLADWITQGALEN